MIKLLISFDFILTLIINIFVRNKFSVNMIKLNFYKKSKFISNYLYRRELEKVILFLTFCHDHVGLVIGNSREINQHRKSVDLSKSSFCKGYFVNIFVSSKYPDNSRLLSIDFEKDGKVQFKDSFVFYFENGIMSGSLENKIPATLIWDIIDFFEEVEKDTHNISSFN